VSDLLGQSDTIADFIARLYAAQSDCVYPSPYVEAGKHKKGKPFRQADRRAIAGFGASDVPLSCVSCVRAILQADFADILPCDDLAGRLWGLLVRTSSREFFKVFRTRFICFGLANLEGFRYGEPLVLVEGVKDAQAVSLFYPYVLAYLTAQPPQLLLQVVSYLTDKVVVFVDNDAAGLRAAKGLRKKGYHVVPSLYKDLGQLWEQGGEFIKDEVKLYVLENVQAARGEAFCGMEV